MKARAGCAAIDQAKCEDIADLIHPEAFEAFKKCYWIRASRAITTRRWKDLCPTARQLFRPQRAVSRISFTPNDRTLVRVAPA